MALAADPDPDTDADVGAEPDAEPDPDADPDAEPATPARGTQLVALAPPPVGAAVPDALPEALPEEEESTRGFTLLPPLAFA